MSWDWMGRLTMPRDSAVPHHDGHLEAALLDDRGEEGVSEVFVLRLLSATPTR